MTKTFKVRGPKGLLNFNNIDDSLPFSDLFLMINKETGVNVEEMTLCKGFPPHQLEIEDYFPIGAFIDDRETLTLSSKTLSSPTPTPSSPTPTPAASSKASSSPTLINKPASQIPTTKSDPLKNLRIIKRSMPDDNSCLFHALKNMLEVYGIESPHKLRELVSNTIQMSPTEYQAYLTKPAHEYVQWIMKVQSWGGAVELGIIAKFFNIEISAIDVQRLAILRFNHPPNQDQDVISSTTVVGSDVPNPTARGIVCYNGIHYDLFVFNTDEHSPTSTDVTLFEMDDTRPLQMALEVCKGLKQKKMYVDEEGMELICDKCGARVIGNQGVVAHGAKTGHSNFRQVQ